MVNAKIREAKDFLSQPMNAKYLTAKVDPRAGMGIPKHEVERSS